MLLTSIDFMVELSGNISDVSALELSETVTNFVFADKSSVLSRLPVAPNSDTVPVSGLTSSLSSLASAAFAVS